MHLWLQQEWNRARSNLCGVAFNLAVNAEQLKGVVGLQDFRNAAWGSKHRLHEL